MESLLRRNSHDGFGNRFVVAMLLAEFHLKTIVLERQILKLNISSLKSKNYSFVLGQKNKIFFCKTDKLILFLIEIFQYFLIDFKRNTKNLFLCEEYLIFLFGREACLRSFQNIFFGVYIGGMFTNSWKFFERKVMSTSTDNIFLISSQNEYFISAEINSLYMPLIQLMQKNVIDENNLFYKVFSQNDKLFQFYHCINLFSNLLLKIRIYRYIMCQVRKNQTF
uniref:Ribosomal protein S2 n=1 Tax=Storeatula sp. CCMP1868 TaxID=195070 RepID=A0A2P1G887_9CRYP|nr:ribosomal protein S2 [Storeatula sp. CCMP1868]AVM81175.1 ribosomal protein S2 [Storeatula sp. CCMP1868]